ncbi:hypothetical protein ACWEQA_29405 [Nocardia sp. NPDC004085]
MGPASADIGQEGVAFPAIWLGSSTLRIRSRYRVVRRAGAPGEEWRP